MRKKSAAAERAGGATRKERAMNTRPNRTEKIIENATLGDVRPGDHIVWERVVSLVDVTYTIRREGIAQYRSADGDWRAESYMWITNGMRGATLTIHRPESKPLPTEIGSAIIAAEVEG